MTKAMVGGNPAGTGMWSAEFHGTNRGDETPGSVVGTFNSKADHASISGAFGAHNVSPDN